MMLVCLKWVNTLQNEPDQSDAVQPLAGGVRGFLAATVNISLEEASTLWICIFFWEQNGQLAHWLHPRSFICLGYNSWQELSSYHHISKKVVWKYCYATISIWSPKKSPKLGIFLFESILKLELWNIKHLVFLGHVMQRCALPFFGKQVHN